MDHMFRFGISAAAALVIFLCLSVPAAGYVQPAPFIAGLMLRHLDLPKNMLVTQELRIYTEPEERPEALEQKIYYRLPGDFRSETTAGQLERIHVSTLESSVTVVDGKLVRGRRPWYNCYKDLFVFASRKNLVDHLSGLGIDMRVSSLGRLDKNLVFVLGAGYPNERRRQLWVDKESFLPLRWIVMPAEKAGEPTTCEIRYLEWRKAADSWYPGKIEFYEKGEKIRDMKVKGIKVDSSLPGELFDVGALRSSASRVSGRETEESGGEAGIRRQLEEFKNIYKSGSD